MNARTFGLGLHEVAPAKASRTASVLLRSPVVSRHLAARLPRSSSGGPMTALSKSMSVTPAGVRMHCSSEQSP